MSCLKINHIFSNVIKVFFSIIRKVVPAVVAPNFKTIGNADNNTFLFDLRVITQCVWNVNSSLPVKFTFNCGWEEEPRKITRVFLLMGSVSILPCTFPIQSLDTRKGIHPFREWRQVCRQDPGGTLRGWWYDLWHRYCVDIHPWTCRHHP